MWKSQLFQMLSTKALPFRRCFSTSISQFSKVNNVAIVGAGLMGSGIAQVTAAAKLNVFLVDQSDEILDKARKSIDTNLRRVAKKKHSDDKAAQEALVAGSLSRLHLTTSLEKAVKDADLVIEAIVENIDVKRKLFSEVEKFAKSTAILTTNTSSLRLADIAANLKSKSQFGGLHFFNPVPVMKLLEIVRHDETSKDTFESLMEYGRNIGKKTVACKDTPGFIVNRLLVPYMFEALRMVDRGDASVEDVDVAMKLGAGYPMGPFELCDYVGLDTTKFIMDGWHKLEPSQTLFTPNKTLDKLVNEGKLGRKSGEGFYKYTN
ncbi:Hydroxyacyl-coenzyme A dehydrogenase [Trichostrongylus colubriformis]|uniref:3-hydroxyacyl-CoA dehydrogenase n=1 Tax=Trichostrongylus colubriformis TaxID=6319 RepID=A0AAN8F9Y9_TRICO